MTIINNVLPDLILLDGTRMTLTVQDTGVGLPQGQRVVDGFGVAQVRERLATTYGDQGAIELVAGYAGGTRATVTFPCENGQQ